MRMNYVFRYLRYSVLATLLGIAGCTSANISKEAVVEEVSAPESQQEEAEADPTVDLDEIIKIAESHYEKGSAYYQEGNWVLAEQEFDTALGTLLDADVDAETHYKLGKAYNKLFYNIHKLALQQRQARLAPPPQPPDEEDSAPIETSETEQPPEQEEPEEPEVSAAAPPEEVDSALDRVDIDETDPDIAKYVKQFSREQSQWRTGLQKAAQYTPMMEEIFREHQLPTELIYMPLVESNFRIDAVSPAGAVGLWQFVRTTARNYGLRVDSWVDERRDPDKATRAAAQYLKDLYDMLGCWDLAMAGYYMGEYRVHKAIGLHRTRDISALAGTKTFGWGAKRYVARIKAAILVATHPEQYGMQSEQTIEPFRYETVQVNKGVSLKDIATAVGVSYQQLKALNPELKKAVTPPGKGKYRLKVPVGMGEVMVAKLLEHATAPAKAATTTKPSQANPSKSSDDYLVHRVQRGETLAKIAQRYGVKVAILQNFNQIHNVRALQIGQQLKVPTNGGTGQSVKTITYTVQKGDTLSKIATRYKIDVALLKAYNPIKNERRLQIGQTLQIPLSKASVLAQSDTSKKMFTYRVKRGDSLSKIASNFGVSVNQLRKWNKVEGSIIYPGSRIKVWY